MQAPYFYFVFGTQTAPALAASAGNPRHLFQDLLFGQHSIDRTEAQSLLENGISAQDSSRAPRCMWPLLPGIPQ